MSEPDRNDRLKAALRENLRRRKSQLRAREAGVQEDGVQVGGGQEADATGPAPTPGARGGEPDDAPPDPDRT